MGFNNSKKFNIYNAIFCLIFSIIILFLFNNISFFNNLLGEVNLSGGTGDSKPVACNDYFFCRAPIILYLYYFLLNSLSIDFVIFLQIFFLVSSTFLITIILINLNLSTWIASFLFVALAINPKILKYSFSIQEESFYIPALLLGICSLIGLILKTNVKNLIYLNLTFALIVLIREAGIVFYFVTVSINIYYLIKIDKENYKKKISLTIILFFILISPQVISKNLVNHLHPEKINNHYFSMHALTSLISKQENFQSNNDDNLSKLINNRIIKLNNIREIKGLDKVKKLNFECIIFPAMNNLSYLHPKILNFYENNHQEDLNKQLFDLYLENFFKNPNIFLMKFHECFFANFLIAELLTKEEMGDMEKILRNPVFDNDDKRIIERFHKISKNYYNITEPLRIINIGILVITLISIIISVKSLVQNKKDKFALLSILFFCMYYLTIHLHVNLISVQVRWFYTYFPLLIFSNLKIIELVNLFFIKKKYLNIYSKK
jgi:hypothetical protein